VSVGGTVSVEFEYGVESVFRVAGVVLP